MLDIQAPVVLEGDELQNVLKHINDPKLIPLFNSGKNNLGAILSLAAGSMSRDHDKSLNFEDKDTPESKLFQKWLVAHDIGLEELKRKNSTLPTQVDRQAGAGDDTFLNLDQIAYTVAAWNDNDRVNIPQVRVFAISEQAVHLIDSPKKKRGPHRPRVTAPVQDVYIRNIGNIHWECYGPPSFGDISKHVVDISGLTSKSKADDKPDPDDKFSNNVSRAEKEQAIREKFKLAPDAHISDAFINKNYPDLGLNENFNPDILKGVQASTATTESPAEDGEISIRQPRPIPKFGDELQDDDMLVVLKNPKSNDLAWNNVRPAYRHNAVLTVTSASGERFGPFPDAENRGGWTYVEVDNLLLAPKIRIVHLMSRTGSPIETTEFFAAEFALYPTKIPGQRDRLRREVSDLTVEKDAEGNLVVDFKTEGCRLTNVYAYTDFNQHNLHKRSKLKNQEYDILAILRRLGALPLGSTEKVSLVISENQDAPQVKKKRKRTALDDLADALHSNLARKVSYPTYRAGTGNLAYRMNIYPSRQMILSEPRHHGLPLPARSIFQDHEEAFISSGMGSLLLGEEQKVRLKSIELNVHTGRVHALGDLVIVAIMYDTPLVTGIQTTEQERIQFPDNCKMKLHMHAGNDKAIYAVGYTKGDVLKLESDLVILLTNKTSEDFLGLTSPILRKNKFTEGKVFKIKVQVKVNETTTATRVDAINAAYTYANKPDLPDWKPAMLKWDFLLNDGKKLAVVRPFAHAAAKGPVNFLASYDKLLESFEWNADQREYFSKLLAPMGGLLLVSGCGGAGKTALLAYTARFAQDNNMKVLMTTVNNSALDDFCSRYMSYFADAEPPLRVYSTDTEDPSTPAASYEPPRDDKTEISMFQAIAELGKIKSRRAAQFSVETKLQKLFGNLDSEPIMGTFIKGYDEDTKEPIMDGDEIDMLDYVRIGVTKLKSHPITDEKEWSEDDVRRLRQSIKVCRAKIISDAPLVVATCVIAANKEMCKYFASNDDDKVLALFDEGPTVAEPDFLAPVAKANYAPKITGIIMVGDIQQLGPINIAGNGTDNTVNEFLSQMNLSFFARMMRSGHPVHTLKTQSRQHEVLAKPIQDLHYDRDVITAPSRKVPLQHHKDLIPNIRGPIPEYLQWDEYRLRLLWVEITNSKTERYPGSGSIANHYHVAYFMDKVLPALQKEYLGQVVDKCMVINPYKLQKKTYERAFHEERCKGGSSDDLPQIYTVDSGQGHEAENVIIDVTQCSREGFLTDLRRINVMFSRGVDRHIVISGPLDAVRSSEVVKRPLALDKVQYNVNSSALLHHKQYAYKHDCLIQVEVSKPVDKVSDRASVHSTL